MPFDRKALAAARQLVLAWGSNLGEELLGSDRAWWTGVITRFSGLGPAGSEVIDSTVSAGRDLYAPVVARACGTALLRDSIVAVIGPSTYSFAVLHLYMLDRGGTPLVYYMNF